HCLQGPCPSIQMSWQCETLLGAEGLNQDISKHPSQTNLTCSLMKYIVPATSVRVLHL
ncbi:hypothetical protein N324_03539, partial [Chlamydotis macqueenii]